MKTPSRPGEQPASESERELAAMLQALARDEAARSTPPRVETALLRAWDAAHRPAGVHPRRWPVVAAAAVLIAVAGGTLLNDRRTATVTPTVSRVPQAAEPVAPSPLVETPGSATATSRRPLPRSARPADPVTTARGQNAAAPVLPPTPAALVLVGTPLTADERVQLVRMRVDRAALAGMGLRPSTDSDISTIDLEVFVGEDGVARAVRLGM